MIREYNNFGVGEPQFTEIIGTIFAFFNTVIVVTVSCDVKNYSLNENFYILEETKRYDGQNDPWGAINGECCGAHLQPLNVPDKRYGGVWMSPISHELETVPANISYSNW